MELNSTTAVGLCCMHIAQCTSALFSGFPISQGNAEALDRWGGKTKHHLKTLLPKIIIIGSCMSRL